jgi:hypothetical protein
MRRDYDCAKDQWCFDGLAGSVARRHSRQAEPGQPRLRSDDPLRAVPKIPIRLRGKIGYFEEADVDDTD